MNRNKSTPKEITKKRLAYTKLMKVKLSENDFCVNKENVSPPQLTIRKSGYTVHNRDAKEFDVKNPFIISDIQRVFTKTKPTKKTRVKPFIMAEPHTICDIDETFYKIIEGRPLRRLDDIKVYIDNIRDITLHRADAAYLRDEILQIDTSMATELEELKAANTSFAKSQDNFVQFAKESYQIANDVQLKGAEIAMKLDNAYEELDALCFRYVELRNKLDDVNITFETLLRYRQFLNYLSPLVWREEHDEEYCVKKSMVCFTSSSAEDVEQDESELHYKRFLRFQDVKPLLFFTEPQQLEILFDDLCRQCLTYMEIEAGTSRLVHSVVKSKNYLKAQAKHDIAELEEFVAKYKEYIKFMEIKEQQFKAKFEVILFKEFQNLFASYEVSKLLTCVQFTNTQVFRGHEDPKDSPATLMRQLEREYLELTSGLDNLNQEVVKSASNEFFSKDIKMMRCAHLAQRTLKECDILSKALFASFEKPRRRHKI